MSQNTHTRYPNHDCDTVRRQFLAADVKMPEELVGSQMERETYLDHVIGDILLSARIPQSRL